MSQNSPIRHDEPAVFQQNLGGEEGYLDTLVQLEPEPIEIKTGAGRLYYALIRQLPTFHGEEEEKAVLCNSIVETIYPLAAMMYAQAMSIRLVTISGFSEAIKIPESLSICAWFDLDRHQKSVRLLSPDSDAPAFNPDVKRGLVVVAAPINEGYHTLTDDRKFTPQLTTTLWEWTEHMVREWYEQRLHYKPSPQEALAWLPRPLSARARIASPAPKLGEEGSIITKAALMGALPVAAVVSKKLLV